MVTRTRTPRTARPAAEAGPASKASPTDGKAPPQPPAAAPHICFDRILPQDLFKPLRTRVVGRRTRAISPLGKTWINGSRLHVRFIGGSAKERANAREQAGWWQAVANLEFVFDDSPQAEIRISFDAKDGAWSYVGTDARGIPQDQPTMNLGFEDGGTAAHEFGHAIGLAHEHQNPQGGIQWNEERVYRDLAGPPNFWTREQVQHNVLARYTLDQIRGTKFDPESIMLYAFPAAWTKNGIATKANAVLSRLDKEFIAGAGMYPREATPPAEATLLRIDAARRTAGAIQRFGQEDLYRFEVDAPGRYTIDTRGPSDVVLKIFGPDSPTAWIAEDDDSGYGANARVRLDLMPGRYWAQVRHHGPAGDAPQATPGEAGAQYTIAVRRG